MNPKIQPVETTLTKTDGQLDSTRRALKERVGLIEGFRLARRDSGRASLALETLTDAQTTSIVNIGLTALALTEAKLRSGLVAASVGQIGALTVAVNAQTSSVVIGLTNNAAAEMFTHLSNRKDNDALLQKGLKDGSLTADEAAQFADALHALSEQDIARGLRRAQNAKDAVEGLAEHATRGIASTKDRLL